MSHTTEGVEELVVLRVGKRNLFELFAIVVLANLATYAGVGAMAVKLKKINEKAVQKGSQKIQRM